MFCGIALVLLSACADTTGAKERLQSGYYSSGFESDKMNHSDVYKNTNGTYGGSTLPPDRRR